MKMLSAWRAKSTRMPFFVVVAGSGTRRSIESLDWTHVYRCAQSLHRSSLLVPLTSSGPAPPSPSVKFSSGGPRGLRRALRCCCCFACCSDDFEAERYATPIPATRNEIVSASDGDQRYGVWLEVPAQCVHALG